VTWILPQSLKLNLVHVQDHLLPRPYVSLMRQHALDACPRSPYSHVEAVIKEDFGQSPQEMFAHFDREPIASASLAQVHRATAHDGQQLAVKVQHIGLRETSTADIATIRYVLCIQTSMHSLPIAIINLELHLKDQQKSQRTFPQQGNILDGSQFSASRQGTVSSITAPQRPHMRRIM
jgi:ABC1 atypical kinase-like domain